MNSQNHNRKLPPWAHLFLLTPQALVLAGCAVGPDFQRPASPAVTGYTSTALPAVTVASPGIHGIRQQFVTAAVPIECWKELHSHKLTRLIDQALVTSPTLAAAQATLRQAQQSWAASSGSIQLPQVNAKLGGQRQGVGND